ncbi:hypothetical protein CLF_108531 [Clonorchis sinensis]|uniref:Uncharacterized protein n=1 Tax=Clonorchis sinensis TaxID=79923 RepID=G7YI74_CLOSI|nr:hypothetical protein CLF_108531 [Clonorchis sinensis]
MNKVLCIFEQIDRIGYGRPVLVSEGCLSASYLHYSLLCLLIRYLLYLIADLLQCLMPGKRAQRREHNSFIPNKRERERDLSTSQSPFGFITGVHCGAILLGLIALPKNRVVRSDDAASRGILMKQRVRIGGRVGRDGSELIYQTIDSFDVSDITAIPMALERMETCASAIKRFR